MRICNIRGIQVDRGGGDWVRVVDGVLMRVLFKDTVKNIPGDANMKRLSEGMKLLMLI